MATRRPLVQDRATARQTELPSADTLDPSTLGTGTRDGTRFLRDDGTYQPVSGGGQTVNAYNPLSTYSTTYTSSNAFTLPSTPTAVYAVVINGISQTPAAWSVSGSTVTVTPDNSYAFQSGDAVVFLYATAAVYSGSTSDDLTFPNGKGPVLTSPNGTKYRVMVDNTGTLGTVVVPNAPSGYTYYRLNITANDGDANYLQIAEFVLRSVAGGAQIATGGTASASSDNAAPTLPSAAFDGDASTYWSAAYQMLTGTLSYALPTAKTVVEYSIQAAPSTRGPRAPRTWTLEGSNNGTSWTVLHTVANSTGWAGGEIRTFTV